MDAFEAASLEASNVLDKNFAPLNKEFNKFRAEMFEIGAVQTTQFSTGQLAMLQPVLDEMCRTLPGLFASRLGRSMDVSEVSSEVMRLLSGFVQKFGFNLASFGTGYVQSAVDRNLDLARFDFENQAEKRGNMDTGSNRIARIFNVMIASPSDMEAERDIATTIITEWNSSYAESTHTVFIVKRWEYLPPSIDSPAQAHINSKLLDSADWLIAMFHTRVGTPTAQHMSGTIEEIDKHRRAGKPAMVYFSNRPVPMNHEPEQLVKIKEYKDKFIGLFTTFDSPDDFKIKFLKHFTEDAHKIFGPLAAKELPTQPAPTKSHSSMVSMDAMSLLEEATRDSQCKIYRSRTRAGTEVRTNGRDFNCPSTPRTTAQWNAALEFLQIHDYIIDNKGKGEVYTLTAKAFEYFEDMRAGIEQATRNFLRD